MRLSLKNNLSLKRRGSSGGGTVVPTHVVIEGDSLINTTPGTGDTAKYGAMYAATRVDKTRYHRGQNSRGLGAPANLNDGGNSLYGHRSEDLGFLTGLSAAGVITIMIGTNPLAGGHSGNPAGLYTDLITYLAPFRAAGHKVGLAEIPPMGSAYSGGSGAVTQFNTDRAVYNPALRAGVGTDFDFLIPIGTHPSIDDMTSWEVIAASDGVHPNSTGQGIFRDVYSAVMESLFGSASATPDFGADVTDAALSGETVRQWIVKGLPAGQSGTAVLSGTNPSHTMRRGAGSYGTSNLTVYNGDVITLKMPHSASNATALTSTVSVSGNSVTVTVTTTAAIDPVTLTQLGGGILSTYNGTAGTSRTVGPVTFTESGTAVVILCAELTTNSISTVTLGGVTMTKQAGTTTQGRFGIYTCAITPGSHSLEVTASASSGQFGIAAFIGFTTGVLVSALGKSYSSTNTPHLTDSMDCPASGFLVGAMRETDSTVPPSPVPSVNAPSTLVDRGGTTMNGIWRGVIVGQRLSTGTISFASEFGSKEVVIASFKHPSA